MPNRLTGAGGHAALQSPCPTCLRAPAGAKGHRSRCEYPCRRAIPGALPVRMTAFRALANAGRLSAASAR